MATYRTTFPGNTALQQEVWTVTVPEAKAVKAYLDMRKGGYWDTTIGKPTRRAVRAKMPTLHVYTAGFSSGEFSNALAASGATITT